jgi:hypothetical protein
MTMTMSTATTPLPHTKSVRDMLLDMLGRDVQVGQSDPWAPTPRDLGAVAVYVDDRTQMRALVTCNLRLAAGLGASIALIPPETADACVEDRRLTDGMGENLGEVFNILTALFNVPERPHLKMYAVHLPGELPAADVSASLRAFGKRSDLEVTVAGYGTGKLSIVLV